MNWIVTLPDGTDVQATGGSAKDAATSVAKQQLGEPTKSGERAEYKVRRKNLDKPPEIVKLVSRCYWGTEMSW